MLCVGPNHVSSVHRSVADGRAEHTNRVLDAVDCVQTDAGGVAAVVVISIIIIIVTVVVAVVVVVCGQRRGCESAGARRHRGRRGPRVHVHRSEQITWVDVGCCECGTV